MLVADFEIPTSHAVQRHDLKRFANEVIAVLRGPRLWRPVPYASLETDQPGEYLGTGNRGISHWSLQINDEFAINSKWLMNELRCFNAENKYSRIEHTLCHNCCHQIVHNTKPHYMCALGHILGTSHQLFVANGNGGFTLNHNPLGTPKTLYTLLHENLALKIAGVAREKVWLG